jgi:hypothetical protein
MSFPAHEHADMLQRHPDLSTLLDDRTIRVPSRFEKRPHGSGRNQAAVRVHHGQERGLHEFRPNPAAPD